MLRQRLATRLAGASSFEDFLDQTRDLVRAERFMIGARLLSQIIDPLDAGAANAGIAAAAVAISAARTAEELAQRHGRVPGARMAVVALGKLGGREMTALSDLDLMIIYETPDPEAMSDGERPIYASEWHARFTQRLVTALTVATKRGTLYEVDLRLRPSGGKGPVAVALPAFRAYHAAESETWERMALTRARVIVADGDFGDAVMAAVREACARKDDGRLMKDIRAMRALVAKEKPPRDHWDLKLTPGGLVDIEFAAQAAILRHAPEEPGFGEANTGRALMRLSDKGWIPPAAGQALLEAWRLQSRLAQVIALGASTPFDVAQARPPFKARLAAAAELPSFAVLDRALVAAQVAAHAASREVLA